ncbi:MAG TPA: PAS domain-containing protein, partial [Spirochaetota bacterium]
VMDLALRESEIRYRTLFENAGDAIFILEGYRYIDCNKTAEKIFRCARTDIIGKTPTDFSPEIQPDGMSSEKKLRTRIQKAYAQVQHFAWTHITGDGNRIAAEVSLAAIHNEKKDLIISIVRDETEKMNVTHDLIESRNQMDSIIKYLPDPTFVIDTRGVVIAWNNAMAEMTDTPDTEMLGRGNYEYALPFFTERQPIPIDFVFQDFTPYKDNYVMIKKQGDTLFAESKVRIFHSSVRSLWATARPLYDTSGTIVGAIETIRDITEIREGEEKIRIALEDKETLLSELYHRTKNNMAMICSIMRMHAIRIKDPTLTAVFLDVENKIQSMALVHTKLYQSKNLTSIDLSEYTIELANIILSSFTSEETAITLVSKTTEKIPITIDTAIPCGLIINEIITNAVKHAFHGRKTGTITLDIHMEREKEISIKIGDNGIGFPGSFDPKTEGGIGIQTVYALCEKQMGGKVTYRVHHGLQWTITFPANLYTNRI